MWIDRPGATIQHRQAAVCSARTPTTSAQHGRRAQRPYAWRSTTRFETKDGALAMASKQIKTTVTAMAAEGGVPIPRSRRMRITRRKIFTLIAWALRRTGGSDVSVDVRPAGAGLLEHHRRISTDGGRTWSQVENIGVTCQPPSPDSRDGLRGGWRGGRRARSARGLPGYYAFDPEVIIYTPEHASAGNTDAVYWGWLSGHSASGTRALPDGVTGAGTEPRWTGGTRDCPHHRSRG